MAVKVLKKKPDPSVVKKVICKECGAKLEYLPKDVKIGSGVSMCEMETWSYIICPSCKKHVNISR